MEKQTGSLQTREWESLRSREQVQFESPKVEPFDQFGLSPASLCFEKKEVRSESADFKGHHSLHPLSEFVEVRRSRSELRTILQ